jgi:hypothetical protein
VRSGKAWTVRVVRGVGGVERPGLCGIDWLGHEARASKPTCMASSTLMAQAGCESEVSLRADRVSDRNSTQYTVNSDFLRYVYDLNDPTHFHNTRALNFCNKSSARLHRMLT